MLTIALIAIVIHSTFARAVLPPLTSAEYQYFLAKRHRLFVSGRNETGPRNLRSKLDDRSPEHHGAAIIDKAMGAGRETVVSVSVFVTTQVGPLPAGTTNRLAYASTVLRQTRDRETL